MYGDGNNTKLTKDIINTMNQVTDGVKDSTGIDLASVIGGMLGGKLINSTSNSEKKDEK